jgi:DNA modification methylase
MLGATKIEWQSVDKLIPYAKNARTHSDEQVAQIAGSIKEFGFNNPVLVDKDNSIIAGHGRLMAARKLGMDKVPVVQLGHMTEAQRKAYVLADNRIALNSGWDTGMLSLELQDLKDDIDLSLLGFDPDELDALLNPIEETEGLTDEDAVPDVPDEPKTKLGDIYILGSHRLMCGDSTSIDDVDKLMDGQKADFCFTSPPYADQREYNGEKELSTEYLATFLRASHHICNFYAVNLGMSRKNGEINQYWDDYINEAKNIGLKLVSWNIWDRSGEGGSIGNMTAPFPINHEWILIFANDSPELNRTIENKHGGKKADGTIRASDNSFSKRVAKVHEFGKLGTIFKCGVQRGKNEHPAMFPVELPEQYILACTSNKELVYEPFGGSGTTMIAAEKLGRNAYLMELDPKYCDVIVKRWEDFTGKKAVLSELEKA